jgi:hypothetical protein
MGSRQGAAMTAPDFYPTPEWVTETLITHCPPPMGAVLEPCAGDGAICRVLKRHYYTAQPVELEPRGELLANARLINGDFLELVKDPPQQLRNIDSIVTNPPFSLAREFAEACVSLDVGYVALLLRLNVLGSRPWSGFWREHPPTRIRPLYKRPSFTGDGKTDACNYGWFVWEKGRPAVDIVPIGEL